ncbi:MAG: helix-turn-helix domain-containing protein, partial [Myxococcota bacterium]
VESRFQLVAGTNADLGAAVREGTFREDLYYRLNVVPISLPALRQRAEDVPLLCEFFIGKYAERLKRPARGVSEPALQALSGHEWPGNIRELENVIERAMLFAEGAQIELSDLPDVFRTTASAAETGPVDLDELNDASLKDIVRQRTSQLERELIQGALEQTGGNVTRAAERLRISRKGLQNKMKELGLREDDKVS